MDGNSSGSEQERPPPNNRILGFYSLVSEFTGTTTHPVKHFIENVETVGKLAHWSDEETLFVMRAKMTGKAHEFLALHTEARTTGNFTRFKTLILGYFDKKAPVATLMQEFTECGQYANESVLDFSARIKNLGVKVLEDDNSHGSNSALIDKMLLSQFLRGLKFEIKRPVLSHDPKTFEEALNYGQLEESNNNIGKQNPATVVSELNEPVSNLQTQILQELCCQMQQLQTGISGRRNTERPRPEKAFYCFYCNKPSHYARDCRKRQWDERNKRGETNRRPEYRDQRSQFPRNRNLAHINSVIGYGENAAQVDINSVEAVKNKQTEILQQMCRQLKNLQMGLNEKKLSYCSYCKNRSHIARDCWTRQRQALMRKTLQAQTKLPNFSKFSNGRNFEHRTPGNQSNYRRDRRDNEQSPLDPLCQSNRMSHEHQPYTLPIVTAQSNGIKFQALIDSGSSLTLIDPTLLGKLQKTRKLIEIETDVCIRAVNGETLKLKASYRIQLGFPGFQPVHNVVVSAEKFSTNYSCIIGYDFWRRYQFSLDTRKRSFQNNIVSVPVYDSLPMKQDITNALEAQLVLKRKAAIPPFSEKFIEVKTKRPEIKNKRVTLEPLPRLEKRGLSIKSRETDADRTGECTVLVRNSNAEVITLNKQMKLAKIQPFIEHYDQTEFPVTSVPLPPLSMKDFNVHDLDISLRKQLEKLLMKNRFCFARDTSELGRCTIDPCRIELSDNIPVYRKAYEVPYSLRDEMDRQLDALLKAKIITRSNTQYAAPALFVKKPSGDYRFCVDYRALNEKVKDVHYPLPQINDLLAKLGGFKYFSTLDLKAAFFQAELHPRDAHKTGFSTKHGDRYHFQVLPMGLKSAPALMQQLAETILGDLTKEAVYVYLDDIIVCSTTVEENMRKLELVFQRFKKANLKLNPSKSFFLKTRCAYLGYIIQEEGILPSEAKVGKINHIPQPKTVKELKGFLGATGFYRRHVRDYAKIATPLTALLKKNATFNWAGEQQTAFEKLKHALLNAPVLAHFDNSKPVSLMVDTSAKAVGAVLMQEDREGNERPIFYFSRPLSKSQSNYGSCHMELFGIVQALRFFRKYAYGRKVIIINDNKPLQGILKMSTASAAIIRLKSYLAEFDVEIQHRTNSKVRPADFLSRVNNIQTVLPSIAEIQQLQRSDPELKPIFDCLEGRRVNAARGYDSFFLEDGVLKHIGGNGKHDAQEERIQLVVPKKLIPLVLKMCHDDLGQHQAIYKTFQRVKADFFWVNFFAHIRTYVRSCETCVTRKNPHVTRKAECQRVRLPYAPLQEVSTDIAGPFPPSHGYQYVLIVIDKFSRYVQLTPLRNISARTVAEAIYENWFLRLGFPTSLVSDNGTTFTASYFTEMLRKFEVKHITISALNPAGNSTSERAIGSIKGLLRTALSQTKQWSTLLSSITMTQNSAFHETLKTTPNNLVFQSNIRLPSSFWRNELDSDDFNQQTCIDDMHGRFQKSYRIVRDNLERQTDRQVERSQRNLKQDNFEFQIGEIVYLKQPGSDHYPSKKLALNTAGPYKIIGRSTKVNYQVQYMPSNRKPFTCHVNRVIRLPQRPPFLIYKPDEKDRAKDEAIRREHSSTASEKTRQEQQLRKDKEDRRMQEEQILAVKLQEEYQEILRNAPLSNPVPSGSKQAPHGRPISVPQNENNEQDLTKIPTPIGSRKTFNETQSFRQTTGSKRYEFRRLPKLNYKQERRKRN